MTTTSEASLLTFPTDFPIKIMGLNSEHFLGLVTTLLQEQVPHLDTTTLERRESSGHKYVSVTCTLRVDSQEQLDTIYRTLSGHPDILMVL
jgi:uncharacterized protein